MDIILTLDYELFLNDLIGTVQNCLLRPTRELQKVCDRYGIKYTIFVDAGYLYALNKLKDKNDDLIRDFETVCSNIRWLQEKEHDIELHIHPQWFYSSYDDGVWSLDWEHYGLADIKDVNEAQAYFRDAKALLDSILGARTIAFRAGGYTLQGFDYERAFAENGILADSSVLPGQKEITTTHKFDYSDASKTPYMFSKDICEKQNDGTYMEFPISVSKKVFIANYLSIKRRFLSRYQNINWGDGGDLMSRGILHRANRIMNSFSLFKQPKATIDYQSFFFLRSIYKQSQSDGYMMIIGHPKNFSVASLEYFDAFAKECVEAKEHFLTVKEYLYQKTKRGNE